MKSGRLLEWLGGGAAVVAAAAFTLSRFSSIDADLGLITQKTLPGLEQRLSKVEDKLDKINTNLDRVANALNREVIPEVNKGIDANRRSIQAIETGNS